MSVRLATACLVVAFLAASAATSSADAAQAAPNAKFTNGWTSATIYLNKRETAYLSLGAGATSTFASALPFPANVLVSSAAAMLSAYAGKAVIDGQCMKIKISAIFMLVQPGTYNPRTKGTGRYCR